MLSKQSLLNISLSEAIIVAASAIAIMGYTIISLNGCRICPFCWLWLR